MIHFSAQDTVALTGEINRINIGRAKITAMILFSLEFLVILITLIRLVFSGKIETNYMVMYVSFLAVTGFYSILFTNLAKKVETHGRQILAAGVLFSIFVLAWCAGIALLDQYSSGQIIVYTAASICIAAVPIFKLQTSLLVFVPVHAAFLILLPRFQSDGGIVFANIINSTTFLCIAVGISYMRYKKQVEDFLKEKIIREKTAELEEANKKLVVFARIDVITGAANRLSFEEELQNWADEAHKGNLSGTCSIIMIDIDYFKEFNDTYGHIRGDLCLKQIAEILVETAGPYHAKVYRIGGDEFAVLLRETDGNTAGALALDLKQAVRQAAIILRTGHEGTQVSISCGIGSGRVKSWDSVTALMDAADKDLYREKALRNKRAKYVRQSSAVTKPVPLL